MKTADKATNDSSSMVLLSFTPSFRRDSTNDMPTLEECLAQVTWNESWNYSSWWGFECTVHFVGIYFAENSSKSNQYVYGIGGGTGCPSHKDRSCYSCHRQLLLCRVTIGKSFLQFSAMRMAHAPPGHHSIVGRPSTGGLTYPEYVVYRGEQVIAISLFCFWLEILFHFGFVFFLHDVIGLSGIFNIIPDCPSARRAHWQKLINPKSFADDWPFHFINYFYFLLFFFSHLIFPHFQKRKRSISTKSSV